MLEMASAKEKAWDLELVFGWDLGLELDLV